MSKKRKVLAVSSPGGHWIQLNKICNDLEGRFDVVYATAGAQYDSQQSQRKIHNIIDASADSKLRLIPLAWQLLFIMIKERPYAIISTGAAPGAVAVLIAKFLPIKTIWVDSIANVAKLSRSGEMVKHHANLVLTQWEPLSDGKKIRYQGSVL
ncbi:MAG: oligosaccharide biosynthesis protein Alg14 [Proteobacteria bacterium]|nr:MAG: oligosaccharide biosynthesis protein Alg14 [Pseudomonadota bacterium]